MSPSMDACAMVCSSVTRAGRLSAIREPSHRAWRPAMERMTIAMVTSMKALTVVQAAAATLIAKMRPIYPTVKMVCAPLVGLLITSVAPAPNPFALLAFAQNVGPEVMRAATRLLALGAVSIHCNAKDALRIVIAKMSNYLFVIRQRANAAAAQTTMNAPMAFVMKVDAFSANRVACVAATTLSKPFAAAQGFPARGVRTTNNARPNFPIVEFVS